jgi:hypothetical protein
MIGNVRAANAAHRSHAASEHGRLTGREAYAMEKRGTLYQTETPMVGDRIAYRNGYGVQSAGIVVAVVEGERQSYTVREGDRTFNVSWGRREGWKWHWTPRLIGRAS